MLNSYAPEWDFVKDIFCGFCFIDQNVLIDTVSLTFYPVTLNSTWYLCYQGWICGPSLRSQIKGLSSNSLETTRLPTDQPTEGRTDGWTCDKQYSLSSSKWGINILLPIQGFGSLSTIAGCFGLNLAQAPSLSNGCKLSITYCLALTASYKSHTA